MIGSQNNNNFRGNQKKVGIYFYFRSDSDPFYHEKDPDP